MKLLQKITSLVMTATIVMGVGSNILAGPKSVKIDAKHFPDPGFRTYVSSHFDIDHNGTLSVYEIEKALVVWIDETQNVKSLKGVKYLTFIKEFTIVNSQLTDTEVDLFDNFNLIKIKFLNVKGFTSLIPGMVTTELEVASCENLKTIDFQDTYYLSRLTLTSNNKLKGDIDLSVSPYLDYLMIYDPAIKQGSHYIDNVYVNKKAKLTYYDATINGKIIKK